MASEPVPAPAPAPRKKAIDHIKIYSHSSLFYWWPVWFFGAVFALWTLIEDTRMVIVPPTAEVRAPEGAEEWQMTIPWTVPEGHPEGQYTEQQLRLIRDMDPAEGTEGTFTPKPRASHRAWMAPVYFLILVLTIIITNVPLRGLWSFVVIIGIILLAVIFAWTGVWDWIFQALGDIHVYVNMAGYMFISICVFVIWALAFWVFDRRTYIVFTPGQIRVREEIGGREKTYDTFGMTTEKHRDDIFRHWVLGFGSGDLTVKPHGADRQPIIIPNVVGIGWYLPQIQELVATRRETPSE
jgi:hypothetical protein